MSEKLSFTVENADIIDENPNSNFAVLSLDFFASGKNLHDMYVSEETLIQTADTIKNCPLVWKYDKTLDDIYTHDKDEVPCGFVPESSTVQSKKLDDGRTMLSVVAYVWKRYTGELLNFFKRDGGQKPVSVEMSVFERKPLASGLTELLSFRYECITVLGSYITPAIPLAHAKVLSFSEIKQEYIQDYKKEFSQNTEKTETNMNKVKTEEISTEIVAEVEQPTPEEKVDVVETPSQEEIVVVEELAVETPSEEDEEKKEDKKEDIEEEKKTFTLPETMSLEKMEELFAGDEEEVIVLAKTEFAKGQEADLAIVMSGMFAKLCKLTEALNTVTKTNSVFIQENDELKKFKADLEVSQKNFEVEKTLREISEKVVLPDEAKEEMVEEAKKYSFADINTWKTYCRAMSFDFAIKQTDKPDFERIGLPWEEESLDKKDDIWASLS